MSLRDRDGVIFVGHHISTGILCALAHRPFLQPYAPFFLGLTELSSTLLCALAVFDKGELGVPGMAETFPRVAQVLGVVFALAFVAMRIVIWPWMSYVFWQDVLAVLAANAQPSAVCLVFLVTNAGLSVLQLAWMLEIIQTAVVLFGPKPKSTASSPGKQS
jgi:hypothetical protein